MKISIILGICLLFIMQTSFATPITGNLNGKVTLVEYYDYECPHCRKMERVIEALQHEYPNLKIIHRVTPLLNKNSRFVASFALAAKNQGQWQAVHQLLMRSIDAPGVDKVVSIVTQLGLNPHQLKNDMRKQDVQQQLATNIQLAKKHSIQGNIYFPILVFGHANGKGQSITLIGEQPYSLVSAIVTQLGEAHVQTKKKQTNN